MERTLILIKPDAMQRGLAGEILTRFERMGLKIIAVKMLRPDREHYYHHYETISKMVSRYSQEIFDINTEFMMQGPVIAAVLEGIEAVAAVRKMVGDTQPKTAAPGTIRGDYSHISYDHANAHNVGLPNLLHASGDPAEAEQEIKHWFSDDELFEYATSHEPHTQPQGRPGKK
jgi:nucleoside-diphosphate kinase